MSQDTRTIHIIDEPSKNSLIHPKSLSQSFFKMLEFNILEVLGVLK